MHINFFKKYDFYFKDFDKITFVPEEWPKGYMACFIDKNQVLLSYTFIHKSAVPLLNFYRKSLCWCFGVKKRQ